MPTDSRGQVRATKRGDRLIDILTAENDSHSRGQFPARVRAERRRLGWTQEDAAVAIGISRNTYRQLEEGRNDPRLSTFMRLVRAGYSPVALVPELFESSGAIADE
jgi:DNA-binding XRE family transcriptional regulator